MLTRRIFAVDVATSEWDRIYKATDTDVEAEGLKRCTPGSLNGPGVPTSLHVKKAVSQKQNKIPGRVQVSLHFLVIVVAFNLMKVAIMICALVTDQSSYLVTLGDAAALFLERHPYATGRCLRGREELLMIMGDKCNQLVSDLRERRELVLRMKSVWLPRTQQHFFTVHRSTMMIYALT